jgi:hypothetical protein
MGRFLSQMVGSVASVVGRLTKKKMMKKLIKESQKIKDNFEYS